MTQLKPVRVRKILSGNSVDRKFTHHKLSHHLGCSAEKPHFPIQRGIHCGWQKVWLQYYSSYTKKLFHLKTSTVDTQWTWCLAWEDISTQWNALTAWPGKSNLSANLFAGTTSSCSRQAVRTTCSYTGTIPVFSLRHCLNRLSCPSLQLPSKSCSLFNLARDGKLIWHPLVLVFSRR